MSSPIRNLTPELVARLAPHRTHEASWLQSLLCSFGLHRWYRLHLGGRIGSVDVRLCRWCEKVRIRETVDGMDR
ncbi:MAG: hypothetical protein ABSD75_03385 [Terriglobales bacterium]|jgi:hypothetical protein